MTAINAIRHGEILYVSADTAWCDKEGRIVSFESQLAVMSNQRALLWTSARGETVQAIAQDVRFEFSSFDEMVEGLKQYLPAIAADHARSIARDNLFFGGDGFEVLLFGWSDKRQRAEAYEVFATDIKILEQAVVMPVPEKGTREYQGVQFALDFQPDPIAQAQELIQIQRHLPFRSSMNNGTAHAHRVGGVIELATVGPFGVRKENIGAYADRMGEMISP